MSELDFSFQPNGQKDVPEDKKVAFNEKARRLKEKPPEELLDSDCFDLITDILDFYKQNSTKNDEVVENAQKHSFTQYGLFSLDLQKPYPVRVYTKGNYTNEESKEVPLGENEQRIDITLPRQDQPDEEAYMFTKRETGVIGTVVVPNHEFKPLSPENRQRIITIVGGSLA